MSKDIKNVLNRERGERSEGKGERNEVKGAR
jgi:hypothetical protein